MVTITRKVKLDFDIEGADLKKEAWRTVFGWQRIVHKAANWIITHQYMQDNVKDMFYYTDEVKKKLANIEKDEDGILTTSRDNTTYQLLSKHFKGECPMGMLSGLNTVVSKKYKSDYVKIRNGETSLASFRSNIPMPIRSADISAFQKDEETGNYSFTVYGMKFKTYFGKDLSGNQNIFDMAIINKEYKLCDSSIQLEKVSGKYKLFFLAVFSFEKQEIKLNPKKAANCRLSVEYPIVIIEKKDKFWNIGTAEEYLHRRLAISGALRRLQAACKYNNGGKGREKKMAAIERFKAKESDYINNRMHLYSKQLIDYCIKRSIGKIYLENYEDAVKETHKDTEESKFLLQSWSYYNLADKIKYKAAKFGIEVELESDKDSKKKKKSDEPVEAPIPEA